MRLIIVLLLTLAFSFSSSAIADDNKMVTFIIKHRSVSGEKGTFVVRTNDPKLIEKARKELAKPDTKRHYLVNGKLASGDGRFNYPWHWHIEDNKWDLVEMSMELCDGTPDMVEKDMKYWVEDVKRFCPWESYVLKEAK